MKRTCVWVGAAVWYTLPLFAQPGEKKTDSTATILLNEVVVTANRFEQKQDQTGKVVYVIGKEQIERSAGRTLGQLLNEQPGITIPGAFNTLGSPQTLSIRGSAPGRTLVLIDGIPAYDPSLINSEFDLNLMDLGAIDRIEIACGAQSTLYGSDAIGGVVNIITGNTQANGPVNVKASALYGSLNTFRGNVQVYGKADKLRYSLRYARLRTDGFSAAHDSTATKDHDNDGYSGHNLSALVQYQLAKTWTVKSFVQRNLYKADIDAGVFADDRDFTIDNKNTMAGAGFQHRSGELNITGNYQYSDIRRKYLNDSMHVPGFTKYVTDDYFGRNQFMELFGNFRFGHGFTALIGADHRFSSMNSQYFSLSSFGPYTSNFSDTSVRQSALYASLIYQRGPLNIEAGTRLNHHSQYGNNATYTFNPSLSINDRIRIFGSIASGFKAPTLYQLFASFGNRDLQPEKATNYEIGMQQSHKQMRNRLVYFHRDINNAIDFDNIRFSYYNINAQTVSGLEWETHWQPIRALTLSGNYTLLLSEERSQSRISAKDTTYNYLLRRPKHNVNATVTYHPLQNLSVSLSGKYVSGRYDAGGYQAPDVRLDGYFLLNAYVQYALSPGVKIFADAQNLLNNTFFDIRGYNAIPRLLNGGVAVSL
ncbi:MAG TPA: TonB-dependent receptor [Phnomibacter sp.]|nr:TonB-dependent receptor [Phnomibacter sp.]